MLVYRRGTAGSCGIVDVIFPQDPLFELYCGICPLCRSGSTVGTRKNLSQSLPEEEQMMFASWLNVSPIIEVNGEHFSVEISKPPMYLG